MSVLAISRANGAAIEYKREHLEMTGLGQVTYEHVLTLDKMGAIDWAGDEARDWFYRSPDAADFVSLCSVLRKRVGDLGGTFNESVVSSEPQPATERAGAVVALPRDRATMSKAAYCSQCGTNVWVSESGGCANGHPRSSLRDEYEVVAGVATPLSTPLVGASHSSQPLSSPSVPVVAQDKNALKVTVADAWKSLRKAKQESANCLARLKSSEASLHEATNRLDSLKSGKGAVLANLYNMAIVYEYWIKVPGHSGVVTGATARMSQTGDVHQVSHVQSTSKSGVGGALAGGLGGTLVGGPLIGAAGALLGNNMARKTKVNTTVSQVDTRSIELEVVGPGYAWSTAYAPDALGKVRQFKDLVNARGSAPQDLDKQTESQEARVAELRDQMRRVTVSNDAAAQEVRTAQLHHQQALGEYAATARTFWDKTKVVFTSAGSGAALPPAIKSTRLVLIAGAVGLVLLSCTICGVLGSLTEPTNPASTTTSVVSTAPAAEAQVVAPVTTEVAVKALFTDPDPDLDTSNWLTAVKVDGATVSIYLAPVASSEDFAHTMSNHIFINMPNVKLVITYASDGQEIGRWSEYKYVK